MFGTRMLTTLALGIVAGGLSLAASAPQGETKTPLDSHRSLGAPKTYQNLTLIPIYDSKARSTTPYITLDEGLKAKTVTVHEAKQGGSVNTLYLTNLSTKPLYIMAGEVVLGGQQDRSLGRDMIIPPGKKEIPLTVFCVEHGRWQGKAAFDRSAKTIVSADIRGSAQEGAFAGRKGAAGREVALNTAPATLPAGSQTAPADSNSANVPVQTQVNGERAEQIAQNVEVNRQVNARARTGRGSQAESSAFGIDAAQRRVWDDVAKKNARFKSENATGTYQKVLELSGGEAEKQVTPYLKNLTLHPDAQMVGVAAAVNGKVVAVDTFGDPVLFRKLLPKLLRSYAADAAEHATSTPAPAVTAAAAKAFLVQASDAASKAEDKSENGTLLRLESGISRSYRLLPTAASAPGMPALHENILRR